MLTQSRQSKLRGNQEADTGAGDGGRQPRAFGPVFTLNQLILVILSHCTDRKVACALQVALPSSSALRVVASWQDFEREAPVADTLVVHVPERMEDLGPQLRNLVCRFKLKPVVVLVARDPCVLLQLLNLGVTEIVFADAGEASIREAICRAQSYGLLGRIASAIEQTSISPPWLRGAMADAVRRSSPPRSAAELAALANCDRTTLWKRWRAAFGSGPQFGAGQFVDCVLLIHAVVRRGAGEKWRGIADELGIHEQTLIRLAKRCTGLRLRDLETSGCAILLERFDAQVLRRVPESRNTLHGIGNDLL